MLPGFSQPRGTKRWAKRTGGLEYIINLIITTVNSLIISGVTPSTFFSSNVQSSATDITLVGMANLQFITFSTTGRSLILAPADSAFFAGGTVEIYNEGSNPFIIKDNAGTTLVTAINPGEVVVLKCKAAADAAGTWVDHTRKLMDMAIMNNEFYSG